jgi:HAD superfamily, subfamily IIIB (Acid phosphatase)
MTINRAFRSTRSQFAACARATTAVLLALACLFAIGLTPGFAENPTGCPPPAGPHALDPTEPLNLGQLKLQLRDYRCFKYDDEVAAVLATARAWVEQRAPQVANPAVVLDIDETSLSNWEEIYHNDFGYIPGGACDLKSQSACGAHDWELSLGATAIAPTLDLFNAAKARNVAVFFVTGRHDEGLAKAATELNLGKAGYGGWDGLYLRDPKAPGASVAEYKRDARIDIEKKGYTIIANIGDQWSDLAFEHAERIFKIPNPFYYIP